MNLKIDKKPLFTIIWALIFGIFSCSAAAVEDFESLQVVSAKLPKYPLRLTMEGVYDGKARVVISVNDEGVVDDVYLEAFTHPTFGKLADKYIRLWTFKPAKLNGEPISVIKAYEFDFEDKRGVHAAGIMESSADKFNWGRFSKSKRTYSPKELDQIPVPVNMETPLYPGEFRGQRVEGSATVLFYIDDEGDVRMPHVMEYSHQNFAQVALFAVEKWKFQPPMVKDKAVAILVRQEFNFYDKGR